MRACPLVEKSSGKIYPVQRFEMIMLRGRLPVCFPGKIEIGRIGKVLDHFPYIWFDFPEI
jgi:hypothetical protein